MAKRKIIQVIPGQVDLLMPAGDQVCRVAIFALCDDGTLWAYDLEDAGWYEVLPVPQDVATRMSSGVRRSIPSKERIRFEP